MKKIIVVFLFFSVIVCGAQVFQNNEHYSETQVSERWNKSDIAIEETSIDYIDTFPGAIEAHSPFLLNNELEGTMEKTGSFKLKEKEKKEKRFSFMLFGLVSIALMIISNIFFFRAEDSIAFVVALASALIAAIAAFVVVAFALAFAININLLLIVILSAAFAAAFAFAAAVIAAVTFATENSCREYRIFVIIYYVFIATHLILLFTGL